MATKTTAELARGDRVRLPGGLVRTVDRITDSGYLNYRNEPIFSVMYVEPAVRIGDPDPTGLGAWSEGNSGISSSPWTVVGHVPAWWLETGFPPGDFQYVSDSLLEARTCADLASRLS